jgi:uncharacterized membrane protein YgcG
VELSLELAGCALHVATGAYYDLYGEEEYAAASNTPRHYGLLRPGGALVMKVYEGAGTNEFMASMRPYFDKVARLRVEASRSMSREFYALGLGRKSGKDGGGGGGGSGGGGGGSKSGSKSSKR